MQNAETVETQFSVFPNPAFNEVQLVYNLANNSEKIQLKIFDVTGSLIYMYVLRDNTGSVKVETENMPSGLYLFRIEDINGLLFSEKVIISK